MKKVTVIDYGLGNLYSVMAAISAVGGSPILSNDPKVIESSERILLPGVGAFKTAINNLNNLDLISPIKRFSQTGRPMLGICLGMQLLFESSEEFGYTSGLSILKGKVAPIPKSSYLGLNYKLPNIGWRPIKLAQTQKPTWDKSILDSVSDGEHVYFLHSYHCIPSQKETFHSVIDFYGNSLAATVADGSIWGAQFHPEKSGETGLKIFKNFLSM